MRAWAVSEEDMLGFNGNHVVEDANLLWLSSPLGAVDGLNR